MTRKNIIDQIRRLIYNGIPTEDATITVGLVNQYLNEGIALAIKKNYAESLSIDGIGSIPDGYYMSFTGIDISSDDATGYYKMTLPQVPVSVDRDSIDISLIKPSGIKTFCSRITSKELAIMWYMPLDVTQVYFWVEGNTAYLWSKDDVTSDKPYVRMPVSQSTDLDSELNCPDDMIPDVIEYAVKLLTAEKMQPMNTSNEGIDTPNIKT